MPRGDRTGPAGYGPMTGRGMGYCAGYDHPGYYAPAPRWGMGGGRPRWGMRFGFGRGWGWSRAYPADAPYWERPTAAPRPTDEERVDFLREQARRLREEAEAIENEIEDMKADGDVDA